MKKITLILIISTLSILSCDGMGKRTNSTNCKKRFDVELVDGSAMWVYGGSINNGFLKGNDEMGQRIYVPMNQILLITEVECDNANK